jgi:thiamine monophosphate synthase
MVCTRSDCLPRVVQLPPSLSCRFSMAVRAGIPTVAIGGLNASNCGEAMRAGAAGIAVVSAIFNKPDVRPALPVFSSFAHC